MQRPNANRSRERLALAALAIAGALMAASPASAHDAGTTDEHGDLAASGNTEACAVEVRAHGVDFGSATFEVRSADGDLLTLETSSGFPRGENDFSHELTIELTAAEAQRVDRVVMLSRDGEHRASTSVEAFTCETDEATPPPCPPVTDVRSENGESPVVRFTIHTVEAADAYRVYRAEGDGAFRQIFQWPPGGFRGDPGSVERISFEDERVEPGTTYSYRVTAINAAGESTACTEHVVTAIPFFGGPLLMALASLGAVGAYGLLRRRR